MPNSINRPVKFEPEKKDTKSAVLFVSLYLVVLAFFVMLNSIAEIQPKRTTKAIGSLKDVFSDVKPPEEKLPFLPILQPIGTQLVAQNYFAPIADLAKEMLALVDAQILEKGKRMLIVIPKTAFFIPETSDVSPVITAFLERLADELANLGVGSEIGAAYVIEFTIGSAEITTNATAQNNIDLSRAGNIGRFLINEGVPETSIFVGIGEEDVDSVTMTFVKRAAEGEEVSIEE